MFGLKMKLLAPLAFICFAAVEAGAVGALPDNNNAEVLLPATIEGRQSSGLTTVNLEQAEMWEKFEDENGEWTVLFDRATGSPHRAFGEPLRIKGFETVNKNNIRQAAEAFIDQYRDILGVNPENLKFVRASEVNNRFYITYTQVYNGFDVMTSEVELRIFANGNVPYFGADYFKNIEINTNPTISVSAAKKAAYVGIDNFDDKTDKTLADTKKYILPVKSGSSVSYKLVYKINVFSEKSMINYTSYVDAHNGTIVKRKSNILNVSTNLNVKANVKQETPADEEIPTNFANMYVTVGSTLIATDQDGNLTADIDGNTTVKASLSGRWARVTREEVPSAIYSGTMIPGEDHNIVWSDANSHTSERILYYATNKVHDYTKEIDPDFTGMDSPMNVTIYNEGQPNAGSDTQTGDIMFFGATDNNVRISQSASVLYHEYGHSINTRLYKSLGRQVGMTNFTSHETFADLNSVAILKRPEIGYGVFAADPTGMWIRNLDNNNIYPDSIMGESHHDSQILSGAYWDLRQSVNNEEWWNKLIHFVKYSLTDDENVGVVFGEWFLETLISDDDDGDLTNGTPHSTEIVTAFNRHQIGTNLLMVSTFEHDQYEDTQDIENNYNITFKLGGNEALGSIPEELFVCYMINNQEMLNKVPAVLDDDGTFVGSIPAQPKGTIITYYITAQESLSKSEIRMPSGDNNYTFLVGYIDSFEDDFETDKGWTVGSNTDNATSGLWERDKPESVQIMTQVGLVEIQPSNDHSEDGTKCYVTGAKAYGTDIMSAFRSLPNGQTTLTSPMMDISKLERPMVRYYHLGINSLMFSNNPDLLGDYQRLLSSDGGETWTEVDNVPLNTIEWIQTFINIENYIELTDKFMFRIIADVTMSNYGVPNSLFNVMMDDFEILTVSIIESVEDNSNSDMSLNTYPNPVSNSLRISYHLYESGPVNIKMFDILGEEIITVVDEYKAAGSYNEFLNVTDSQGNRLSSGIYLLKMQISDRIVTKKVVVE